MACGEENNGRNYENLDDTRDFSDNSIDRFSSILGRLENRLQNLELTCDELKKGRPVQVEHPPFYVSSENSPNTTSAGESQQFGARPKVKTSSFDTCREPNQAHSIDPSPELTSKFTSGCPEFHEIQEKFSSIKQSVEKVILPSYMKLHDSRTGIKRDDQPLVNVISKSGRYVETILKLLSESGEGKELDIVPVVTTLLAHIQYLQEEFAALLVKGKFDDGTAQLVRSLQRGTSGFTEASLQNVRVAAELSSIANRFPGRDNSNSYFRGRSRGNFVRGFRGFGQRGRGTFGSGHYSSSFDRGNTSSNKGYFGGSYDA